MGVSKAEVNLKRLLRAQGNQTNEAKLLHYVATMRSLLAELTGDPAHQDQLPTIPASRARDYAQQIDLVAQKLRGRGVEEHSEDLVEDVAVSAWEPVGDESAQRGSGGYVERAGEQQGMASMRRRLRGDDVKSGSGGGKPGREAVRVDASLQSLVQRHRELQEGLTDEMVMLSAQLKESSLLMDQALHETDKVLESTEDAVEYSLASTNRANQRMGTLSSQSWKTSCLTWLVLFMVFGMFMFMVVLIRVT
jgi:SNARE protein 1